MPKHAATHRIMVVDDNVDAAESLAMMLELDGHSVIRAHDGPLRLQSPATSART